MAKAKEEKSFNKSLSLESIDRSIEDILWKTLLGNLKKSRKRYTRKIGSSLRMDIEKWQPLTLMLDIKAIKQMPSGWCYVIPSVKPAKDTIVVCKEKDRIKIFKLQEEPLHGVL